MIDKPTITGPLTPLMMQAACDWTGRDMKRTWEVGLGAAGFVAGAAEGPGGAGVTVLRLRAATSQTSHLAVRPVNHLDELSHPEDRRGGRRVGKEETQSRGRMEGQKVKKRQHLT